MADLEAIRNDILREMYSEAEPGLDFDDVLENPDEYGDEWFKKHTLPSDREREILNKHLDKYNLTDSERSSLTFTCILNYGPSNPISMPDEEEE